MTSSPLLVHPFHTLKCHFRPSHPVGEDVGCFVGESVGSAVVGASVIVRLV